MSTRKVLFALALLLLITDAFAFSKIAMGKKNQTVEERHEIAKRSNRAGGFSVRRADAPLGGGFSIAYYFVSINYDGIDFYVDIDTGSSILYIVGKDCHYTDAGGAACSYANNYYTDDNHYSSCMNGCNSCIKSTCIMTTTYGDGSTASGAMTNQALQVGGYSGNAYASIIYQESTSFSVSSDGNTYMDGLWGLAYSSISGGIQTPIEGLVQNGMPNTFSMCLNPLGGGYLVLGGIDNSLYTGSIQYTPIIDQSFYVVNFLSITVGSTQVGYDFSSSNGVQTIVDSGTTFVYLPSSGYFALQSTMESNGVNSDWFSTSGSPACSTQALGTMPTLNMAFDNGAGGSISLTLTPSMYTVPCGAGQHALSFQNGGGNAQAILGDAFLQGFYTIFDRANVQVGFAPVSAIGCTGNVPLATGKKQVPGTTSPFAAASSISPVSAFAAAILALTIALLTL